MNIIRDNLKIIIGALIALIFIIIGAIWLSITFGGQAYRNITVSDISGSVTVIRDTRQFFASKNTVLKSGDIINTTETSRLRIRMDFDKYVVIEPNSTVYIYHTGITDSGEISVNVRGTVFRTEFELKPEYKGYKDVMITHVQNFEGSVKLQLYNTNSEKVDGPMLLTERTSAELISCSEFAQYGYLNYDTDLYALNELTVMEMIRISGERSIAYTLDELNIALKAVRRRIADESAAAETTLPPETESSEITEASVTTTVPSETAPPATEAVTEVPSSVVTEAPPVTETTTNTLATTRATQAYTIYTGPKWWEMPNDDPDPDDNDFDDGGVFNFGN